MTNGRPVIPSVVEAATQRTKSARPGFQPRGEALGTFTGSFDFAQDDSSSFRPRH
jgi:hypothetical protein